MNIPPKHDAQGIVPIADPTINPLHRAGYKATLLQDRRTLCCGVGRVNQWLYRSGLRRMLICTFKECSDWCAAHGYPTRHSEGYVLGPDPDLTEPAFRFAMFSIPEDASRRVALAKNLIALLDESAELLVQIGDWAVWPSGQHMPLFARFREAFGERRRLIEAPGHVIPGSERDDAVSILVLSMLYLWNCHVLSANGNQALFVSHDEYGWFAMRADRSLEPANQLLEKFGVLTAAGPAT